MIKRYLSYYHPRLPIYVAYMLQQVEYNPGKFFKWIVQLPDLTKVMRRQELVWTFKAKILVGIVAFFWLLYIALAFVYLFVAPISSIITFAVAPFMTILITYILVTAAWFYVEEPRRRTKLKEATKFFKNHSGITIAISGSYGKTSMKELLQTVLSQGLHVAATPGNKNVPISHAAWVKKLTGSEDVLLIEYGEGAPGDIKKLAKLTQPDFGIITGLAPNHLEEYKTLDAVAKDLLSLSEFVPHNQLYVDTSSDTIKKYDVTGFKKYEASGVMGWKVSGVKVGYEGTSFMLQKGKDKLQISSGLLGEHQVAPLALVAVLAHKLGLSKKQIETGMSLTMSYEHRMQPRKIHGAWLIDDTYNGSFEGLKAGIALMKLLPAKRKMYVTPGLVDQGIESTRVHRAIGKLLAEAQPDRVVLMKNSVTENLVEGLEAGKFNGELQIQDDPLAFYTGLDQVVAAGDLVVMQNDWTDNYN